MTRRFVGSRVVVTGGASGFGAAMAYAFGHEGASVVVADIDGDAAQRIADDLPGAIACQVDVTDDRQNRAMVAAAVNAWDGIDIVCANAGVPHPAMPLIDLPTAAFDRTFAVNVRGVYLAAKHSVPHMTRGGSIIATASIGAIRPRPGLTAYNASKAAVVTLVRGLATELAPEVRVNAVLPVSAATGFDRELLGVDEMPEKLERRIIRDIPMGRRAEPSDIADAVLFLASEQASFLTGVCLDVDGGRSIQ